jgi:hypothetical protein
LQRGIAHFHSLGSTEDVEALFQLRVAWVLSGVEELLETVAV